jgi:hypothetical protein
MVVVVKLVVQIKLLPTPEQAPALEATLHAVNEAANRVSAVAFEKFGLLHRLQGPPHGRAGARGGRALHLPDMPGAVVRPCRAGQPARPGHLLLSSVRVRWPGDVVAGINVRTRARSAWAFVNMPDPPA